MLGTINDVSIDDFMAMSGIRVSIERAAVPDELIGHDVEDWCHFRVCLWIEGHRGEYNGRRSIRSTPYITQEYELTCIIKDVRCVVLSRTSEEFAFRYGSGLALYPELAADHFQRGKKKVEELRRIIGDEWFDFMVANVATN